MNEKLSVIDVEMLTDWLKHAVQPSIMLRKSDDGDYLVVFYDNITYEGNTLYWRFNEQTTT